MTYTESRSSQILLSAALEAGHSGLHKDSDKLFDKAKTLGEKALGKSAGYAQMLIKFADMCADSGRIEKAESLYHEALPIFCYANGSEHLSIAILMRNLADLCKRQGKEADAEAWKRQSMQIMSKHRSS